MQITFTDLDLDAYGRIPGYSPTLAIFVHLGRVDCGFREKPRWRNGTARSSARSIRSRPSDRRCFC